MAGWLEQNAATLADPRGSNDIGRVGNRGPAWEAGIEESECQIDGAGRAGAAGGSSAQVQVSGIEGKR